MSGFRIDTKVLFQASSSVWAASHPLLRNHIEMLGLYHFDVILTCWYCFDAFSKVCAILLFCYLLVFVAYDIILLLYAIIWCVIIRYYMLLYCMLLLLYIYCYVMFLVFQLIDRDFVTSFLLFRWVACLFDLFLICFFVFVFLCSLVPQMGSIYWFHVLRVSIYLKPPARSFE